MRIDDLEATILSNREARELLQTPVRELPKKAGINYGHIRPQIDRMYDSLEAKGIHMKRSPYFSDGWGVTSSSVALGIEFSAGNPKLLFLNDCLINARYMPNPISSFIDGRQIRLPLNWSMYNPLLNRIIRHEKHELVITAYQLEKVPALRVFGDFSEYTDEIPKEPGDANLYLHWVGGKIHRHYENRNAHERLAGALTALDLDLSGTKGIKHEKALVTVLKRIKGTPPVINSTAKDMRMRDIEYSVAEHYGVQDKLAAVKPYSALRYHFLK